MTTDASLIPEPNSAALVEARFAAEDEARSRWLNHKIAQEQDADEERERICKRGHRKTVQRSGKWYCPTCNAIREREARAQGKR